MTQHILMEDMLGVMKLVIIGPVEDQAMLSIELPQTEAKQELRGCRCCARRS